MGIKNMYRKRIALAVAAACLAAPVAQAGEREDLELLRQTTTNLIEALVDKGILPREAADDLITKAQKKATATVVAQKAQEGKTVRVAYVPESVKAEIREQIKQDVLAQAKNERWGDPGTLPEWMDRIQWEGDIRVRYQEDNFDKSNSSLAAYQADYTSIPGATRFPDAADGSVVTPSSFNTLDDRNRIRLRARLGVLAKITPMVSAGVRLTTGNTTDRVSTNQSLGQNFNKYTAVFDRAYLRLDPTEWLTMSGGRIPNPWFGSDLVWDDDLNFEGVAATFKPSISPGFSPFLTLGAFPLREDNPPSQSNDRWLFGAQVGAQWDLSSNTRSKFGIALYNYQHAEGKVIPNAEFAAGAYTSSDSRRYEYPNNLRQKGNTLFSTNAANDLTTAPIWGLASKFRVLNINGSLDLARWDPVHLVISGDYAKNLGYDHKEMQRRTGMMLDKGKDSGWQVKTTLGMPRVKEARDWQVSLAYRYLGSDAVLDAFTDSDYNLGGTNHKGYVLGFSYGVDRNTTFNLRWLSFDSIDSTTMMTPGGKFSTDVLQADMSASF